MKKLIFITVFLLISCNSFKNIDDIAPMGVLTEENLITDEESAENAISGVYNSWRTTDIGWFVNFMSVRSGTENQGQRLEGISQFAQNNILSNHIKLSSFYEALYKVINSANYVIEVLEEKDLPMISQQRKGELISQAKFSRALAHFQLLRCFGEFYDINSTYGVVIFEKPVKGNIPKARSNVKDVYQFIISDLQYAIQNGLDMPPHYLAGKMTAKALLAKVFLTKGDYAQSAQIAKEVIDESGADGYMLENSYLDIFKNKFNSSEVLFAPYVMSPHQNLFMQTNGLKAGKSLTQVADDLVPGMGNLQTGDGFDKRYAIIYSEDAVTAEGNAFITDNNKYYPLDYINETPTNTNIILRLAEIYLILAEAEAREGNFLQAREALKVITDRAEYTPNYVDNIADADLLEMIFKHKWVELNAENYEEWFDMVRYHKIDGMQIAPNYIANDKYLLLPIPRKALGGNILLVQNPNYKN